MSNSNYSWCYAGHNQWCCVRLTNEKLEFQVNQGVSQNFATFDQAADYTANLLYQTWNNKPLYLSLSGGIDSEFVANILLRNNIPFTPYILDVPYTNSYELWYAKYWCYKNKIVPIIKTIDFQDYESIFVKYSKKIRDTHQVGIPVNLYIADQIHDLGGYCVNGLTDINQENDQFYCNVVDYSLELFDPGKHPTGFFMYTPEIAFNYILQFDPAVSEQYNKLSFYNVSPRPKIDYLPNLWKEGSRMHQLRTIWKKRVPNTDPHWFGSKQDILNLLTTN